MNIKENDFISYGLLKIKIKIIKISYKFMYFQNI